ncbi:MAG: nitroreductase family protein [Candidatus Omnitrophota bacterium]
MDFIETVKVRRSVRDYTDKAIPGEALRKLVDAARFAPTARGVEPWEFIIITETVLLRQLGDLAENGRFLSDAAACIAVFCKDTKYYLEDGCAATQNILLSATALGIGSCWVAGDKKPYCSQVGVILNVPLGYKLVSLISLGYPVPEDAFKIKDKRKLDDLIHWEGF